ncbi:hypothetical protein L1987_15418 [Smallanthus sonchifolius]|uniref:Uncharacterized protein n=1 Tax=Smallanthus sonchifolius TaxID=185202 RepID=A0ACB9J5J9_9ASTR|nr:hypothetical protein L1987_15418 [Smallanthus sonchifolius]
MQDIDSPISSAFSSHGIQGDMYIITIGVVTALYLTLMGSLLPKTENRRRAIAYWVLNRKLAIQDLEKADLDDEKVVSTSGYIISTHETGVSGEKNELQATIDSVSLSYSNIISTHETEVEVSKGQNGVSGKKNELLQQK